MDLDQDGQHLILTPITREYVHSLRRSYRRMGLLEVLVAEKSREREL